MSRLAWALCLPLLGLAAWPWLAPQDDPTARFGAAIASPAGALRALPPEIGGFDRYAAALERPLFSPSRRPPPRQSDATVTPAAAPPELEWRLIGLVSRPDRRAAMLRASNGGATRTVTVGETLGRWKVETITADHVTLIDGAERRSIALGAPGK